MTSFSKITIFNKTSQACLNHPKGVIPLRLFTLYLAIINIVAILLTLQDKRAARLHHWRIKERTLLLISALGGSVGMLVTMLIIRHKTKHAKFTVGIPAMIALQLVAMIAVAYWRGAL